jgi:hypothetical protein
VYSGSDALLTRNAFFDALETLGAMIGQTRYRTGCTVDLGITLTRSAPELRKAEQVLNQRFVVPLRAREHERKIVFGNWPYQWGDNPNNVKGRVAMPENDGEVKFEPDVAKLIQASSAFPVAFAAIPLDVCEAKDVGHAGSATGDRSDGIRSTPKRAYQCPQTESMEEEFLPNQVYFSDGGFFDNIPLGLAGEMAHDKNLSGLEDAKSSRYWYVNSDIRRPARQDVSTPIDGDGLSFLGTWFFRGLTEARSYELQVLTRYRPEWFGFEPRRRASAELASNGPSFKVIDRHPPLVGDYLRSFGAFVNRAFRVYDYYAGVYDSMVNLSGPRETVATELPKLYRRTLRPRNESVDPVGERIVQLLAGFESPALGQRLERDFSVSPAASKSLPVLVLETLHAIEQERAYLRTSGNPEAAADFNQGYESPAGFWGFLDLLGRRVRQAGRALYEYRKDASDKETGALRALPGYDDADELDRWTAAQGNALARRFIEIEKADRIQYGGTSVAQKNGPPQRGVLRNPCGFGNQAFCVRDLFPNSLDFVARAYAIREPHPDLTWQTSIFPLFRDEEWWGNHVLSRVRYVRTLAPEHSNAPADRLSVTTGYAHSLDPGAFSVDVGPAFSRFPGEGGGVRSGLELSVEWKVFRSSALMITEDPPSGTPSFGDRFILTLGLKNLNVPLGWFLRRDDRVVGSDSDASWNAQRVAAASALLLPLTLERPEVSRDAFGFRSASAKARILRGAPRSYYVLPALAPNHVDVDFRSRSVLFGYEPLRFNALGDSLSKGMFVDVGAGARRFLSGRGELPDSHASWQLTGSVGLGFDPAGRSVDDLRIAPTGTYEWNSSRDSVGGWHVGAEASALFMGGLIRVGFALPKLFSSRWRDGAGATDTMAVTLGFGDFDGLVAWLLRWSLLPRTSDEGRKDGDWR